MEINVNNMVRSGVILLIGLPLSVGFMTSSMKTDPASDMVSSTRAKLVEPCLDFMVSKPDSPLERKAQDRIDGSLGSNGADYRGLCKWVLN